MKTCPRCSALIRERRAYWYLCRVCDIKFKWSDSTVNGGSAEQIGPLNEEMKEDTCPTCLSRANTNRVTRNVNDLTDEYKCRQDGTLFRKRLLNAHEGLLAGLPDELLDLPEAPAVPTGSDPHTALYDKVLGDLGVNVLLALLRLRAKVLDAGGAYRFDSQVADQVAW